MRQSFRAFTLIELLVVIAIIGTLVALLLPAVQAAREAARRSQCSNNMKQFGLALHSYHSSMRSFPITAGTSGDYSETATGKFMGYRMNRNWIVGLLPFVEEQNRYAKMDMKKKGHEAPNAALVQENLPLALCPSDGESRIPLVRVDVTGTLLETAKLGLANYAICMGDHNNLNNAPSNLKVAPSSTPATATKFQVFCREGFGPDSVRGVSSRYAWACNIDQIRDGLSQTFFIGEIIPQWCAWQSWGLQSFAGTGYPLNSFNATYMAGTGDDKSNDQSILFRSFHPGGGHFSMCDGSIRFIADSIDMNTYWALSSRSSGEVISGDF